MKVLETKPSVEKEGKSVEELLEGARGLVDWQIDNGPDVEVQSEIRDVMEDAKYKVDSGRIWHAIAKMQELISTEEYKTLGLELTDVLEAEWGGSE